MNMTRSASVLQRFSAAWLLNLQYKYANDWTLFEILLLVKQKQHLQLNFQKQLFARIQNDEQRST